jgi:hypothetical protein
MDLTATLTAAEIESLADYHNRSLQDAEHELARATYQSAHRNESAFEKSLRIKNTLDVFEEASKTLPTKRALAVLVNCEYQLWRLNADTRLEDNPFLSHWVEAIQRLDTQESLADRAQTAAEDLLLETSNSTRVLWIKAILEGDGEIDWSNHVPEKITVLLQQNGLSKPFDLRPYIRMLEEAGIYEKTLDKEANPSTHPVTHSRTDGTTSTKKTELSLEDLVQQQKDDILRNLQAQPDVAVFDITRLPITLTHLDFLTTILTDRLLERHSIDPAPVITQYIQHALRTVERMGKPPSPSPEGLDGAHAGSEVLEYGKEAQSRCILLLLLFIKSLLRKRLVELDVLFYEIAEITVRYVWIKEVRDFRTWVEEGVEVDGG